MSKLGEGGMGIVFLAQDTELDRRVALKFLHTNFTKDERIRSRFKQEARMMASISHPNIITVFEVGDYKDQSYIAMEYVEGDSLDNIIKNKELSLDQILELAIQICAGLSEAHKQGIIHRDIKPGNIRIDKKGLIKILDFGLAKLKEESRKTSKSTTIGTLYYLSPEQLKSSNVDHRADIFSFGVVLYELITSKLPFRGEYEAEVLYSILNEEPEPLMRYKTGVSEDLQKILDKALEKNIEKRYQHIDDLMADLKNENEALKKREKEATSEFIQERKIDEGARKLAAIMFIDIVGFSQMMGLDEDQTLRLLKEYEKIVTPVIQNFRGTVLKKLGDGLFCEFSSAVGAVNCAIKIHETLDTFSQSASDNFKMLVRIGIHLGDVVIMHNDLYGDGVNVAARLERIAPPGGICISQAIYSAISSHPKFKIISLGEIRLKNIAYKHHLYQVKTGFESTDIKIHKSEEKLEKKVLYGETFSSHLENSLRFIKEHRGYIYSVMVILLIVGSIIIFKRIFDSSRDISNAAITNDSSLTTAKESNDGPYKEGIEKIKSATSQEFISEILGLENEQALMSYLNEKQIQGKLTFGKQSDYYNPQNKFVIVFDDVKVHAVLLYYSGKFIDQSDYKLYDALSSAFKGKKMAWIELL